MAKQKPAYSARQIEKFQRDHGYELNRLIALSSEFGMHLNEGSAANCEAVMKEMAEVGLRIQDRKQARDGRDFEDNEATAAPNSNVTALRSGN
jgi:hypothetical protein